MTHQTDEELDAMVSCLIKVKGGKLSFTNMQNHVLLTVADAITTIRTQLAAANARAEQAEQRVATLEAALAAQIEADARIAEDAWLDGVPVAEISAAIRAHSHDRSALDRMLAEASEKVLREAADMFDADSNIAQTILALIEADHAQP